MCEIVKGVGGEHCIWHLVGRDQQCHMFCKNEATALKTVSTSINDDGWITAGVEDSFLCNKASDK